MSNDPYSDPFGDLERAEEEAAELERIEAFLADPDFDLEDLESYHRPKEGLDT